MGVGTPSAGEVGGNIGAALGFEIMVADAEVAEDAGAGQ